MTNNVICFNGVSGLARQAFEWWVGSTEVVNIYREEPKRYLDGAYTRSQLAVVLKLTDRSNEAAGSPEITL